MAILINVLATGLNERIHCTNFAAQVVHSCKSLSKTIKG